MPVELLHSQHRAADPTHELDACARDVVLVFAAALFLANSALMVSVALAVVVLFAIGFASGNANVSQLSAGETADVASEGRSGGIRK